MQTGISQIQAAIQLLFRHKVLIIPYGGFWVCLLLLPKITPRVPESTPFWVSLLILWYVPVILFTLASFMLLELIEQIESDQPVNLLRAVLQAVSFDLVWSLPIILVWSLVGTLVWLLLFPLSLLSGGLTASLQKRLRLSILFVLPAIAWEQVAPWRAVQKGNQAAGEHWAEFVTSFGISDLVWKVVSWFFLLFLLVAQWLSGMVDYEQVLITSTRVMFIILLFFPFVLSFMIYIEQLVAAELYLWHLRWFKAIALAEAKGHRRPRLDRVDRPSLLNEIPELVGVIVPAVHTEANTHVIATERA